MSWQHHCCEEGLALRRFSPALAERLWEYTSTPLCPHCTPTLPGSNTSLLVPSVVPTAVADSGKFCLLFVAVVWSFILTLLQTFSVYILYHSVAFPLSRTPHTHTDQTAYHCISRTRGAGCTTHIPAYTCHTHAHHRFQVRAVKGTGRLSIPLIASSVRTFLVCLRPHAHTSRCLPTHTPAPHARAFHPQWNLHLCWVPSTQGDTQQDFMARAMASGQGLASASWVPSAGHTPATFPFIRCVPLRSLWLRRQTPAYRWHALAPPHLYALRRLNAYRTTHIPLLMA